MIVLQHDFDLLSLELFNGFQHLSGPISFRFPHAVLDVYPRISDPLGFIYPVACAFLSCFAEILKIKTPPRVVQLTEDRQNL